jgi:hypothetical protein
MIMKQLFRVHPAPWSVDDNRAGHEGMLSVYDANGEIVLPWVDMEDCEAIDLEFVQFVATMPDLFAIAANLAAGYNGAKAEGLTENANMAIVAIDTIVKIADLVAQVGRSPFDPRPDDEAPASGPVLAA